MISLFDLQIQCEIMFNETKLLEIFQLFDIFYMPTKIVFSASAMWWTMIYVALMIVISKDIWISGQSTAFEL